MKQIHLAEHVSLPAATAVTQVYAFLGRRGSGKTYGAGKLVEGLLTVGAQVIIFDPLGKWYGLRLDASGKKPSPFAIPVFGGKRGDVALTQTAGALVAKVLLESGSSAVLDVSQMRKGQRKQFVTEFLEELYALQKDADAPRLMHVVLEEARVFCPQKPQKGEERMLGAVEDIVRLGRNHGIGATLIDQRPQSVNKEALSQAEVVVAMQLNGVHERAAVRDWIRENTEGESPLKYVDVLPHLAIGEAIIWSPQWLQKSVRTRILPKQTFDASATPVAGAKIAPPAPLDKAALETLRGAMVEVEERAAADDPRKLRTRIAELERECAQGSGMVLEKQFEDLKAENVRLKDLRHSKGVAFEVARRVIDEAIELLTQGNKELLAQAARVDALTAPAAPPAKRASLALVAVDTSTRRSSVIGGNHITTSTNSELGKSLKKGARSMLEALARRHPTPLTRDQVATLAGLSPRSGTFSDYLSSLRTGGFVSEDGTRALLLTVKGLTAAGGPAPARGSAEVLALWLSKIHKAGARRMLQALVDAPYPITRTELAAAAEISPASGTFSDYLSILRRNGLLDELNDRSMLACQELRA